MTSDESSPVHKECGPIQLLILQATPFCNLNCTYCYLPERSDKSRMSIETVKAAVDRVFDAGLVSKRFTIVWHAGEPMVVGTDFYRQAIDAAECAAGGRGQIRHTLQTNGVLLSQAWCTFIRTNAIRVGVSVDGPAFLHDQHRQTLAGGPTHAAVMRGIRRLQSEGIDFYTISVLSAHSLNHPDEMFEFFDSGGFTKVCFNLEEAEGIHFTSSLGSRKHVAKVRSFFDRFYRLYRERRPRFSVREFERIENSVERGLFRRPPAGQQTVPFRILTVASNGDFSTFAPELLGMKGVRHDGFVFGNVHSCSLLDALATSKLKLISDEIRAGVEKCRQECQYFCLCGGGSPSNKFSEHQRMDVSETMHCLLRDQAIPEAVLTVLMEENERGARH